VVKVGIVMARHLTIRPETSELRVFVRDAASQELDSGGAWAKALLADEQASPARAGFLR
jgi:hypothetical protein